MEKIWLQRYQPGVPTEINADAYTSLAQMFSICCEKYQNSPALSNLGQQLSYQQLAELSRRFAAYLQQKLGLKKGERIAIMLPNILQYPVALFGALQAGLIVVNVNPLYTVPELVHQVNDAGAETIVVMANFAHVVQAALAQTAIKHVLVTELGDLFTPVKSYVVNFIVKYLKKMIPPWQIPHAIAFNKVLREGKTLAFNPVSLTGNDIAFLQYTGGTTGVAKGTMLSHRNMVANVEQVVSWVKPALSEMHEIVITPLPLYHVFSLTANCLTFLRFGALNVLITNPRDITRLIKELSKFKFTTITGVNTLFSALLNHPDFARLDFSALKVALGGGAALQAIVAERWQKVTGKALYEGYGLTETSPVVSITPLDLTAFNGSIGLPVASTEVSFRDNEGNEVPFGEAGELCVRGPQIMQGYWQNPVETSKVLTKDGWLHTGDIARMDKQGFIYLIDRKKDMILVSGFNVYPNEIEDVIAAHPGVAEVAVVGVPDEHSGEAVKAFIVKRDPALTTQDILTYCHQRLTGYKLPRLIEFRDNLPKSPVGKILRRELRGN